LWLTQALQFLDEFQDPVEWILETGKELERACKSNATSEGKKYNRKQVFFGDNATSSSFLLQFSIVGRDS
jgi:hypothetical protein